MIIGNGLIGKHFMIDFFKSDKIILFASGVSDSLCNDDSQFKREENLLLSYLKNSKNINYFIYFSTISIYDPSINNSPYVKHKMRMESLILNYPNTIIFRIGQVASHNMGNKNNLLNFIDNAIISKKKIELWRNSYRSIIDIEDVVKIINKIITNASIKERIINVTNPKFNSMNEIVNAFEEIKNMKVRYVFLDKGEKYEVNLDLMSSIASDIEISFDNTYLERVLKKYYL